MTALRSLRSVKKTCLPTRRYVHSEFHSYADDALEAAVCRGELRLAAEVILAHGQGVDVPRQAYDRAIGTLTGLAK